MADDLVLRTEDGCELEAEITVPEAATAIVVLTHPHPLYGGDMHNSVPATLFRHLPTIGFGVLRFNFRGVGSSSGTHGNGTSELADVVAAIDAGATLDRVVYAVGYSFGADVLLAVDDERLERVAVVAPPLQLLPRASMSAARGPHRPTLVLSPTHDQFCDHPTAAAAVGEWPATHAEPIAGADHFVAGKLDWIADRVATHLRGE